MEPPKIISTSSNKKKQKMTFKWSNNFKYPVDIPSNVFKNKPDNVLAPIEYFSLFFKPEIFNIIVENTNLYGSQKSIPIDIDVNEIKHFIGIQLIMGIVSMPAYTDYWSINFRYNKIADVMNLKRFQLLRRNLHFIDSAIINTEDRYYKVRPILEHVKKNCLGIDQGFQFSIDEMMIPYKKIKAGTRRQYIKNKPKKWGFKMFTRSGIDGFVYDFLPYGGENTFH